MILRGPRECCVRNFATWSRSFGLQEGPTPAGRPKLMATLKTLVAEELQRGRWKDDGAQTDVERIRLAGLGQGRAARGGGGRTGGGGGRTGGGGGRRKAAAGGRRRRAAADPDGSSGSESGSDDDDDDDVDSDDDYADISLNDLGEDVYVVERIEKKRTQKKKVQYYVRWQVSPTCSCTPVRAPGPHPLTNSTAFRRVTLPPTTHGSQRTASWTRA